MKRYFKYSEITIHDIELNPYLKFVCNGNQKIVEVINDEY